MYYESHDDLLRKTEYYLNHEDERAQIARNGHEKQGSFIHMKREWSSYLINVVC